ncbi:E3 ubiquitin-protein like [Actinidia chinensis var. chinensis]|uniref:RING-type E3 ubiquitin transferase n=1 Tax=Actinidia chinensis var. chinensis TaxID=1590841 RepID=A0A2R6PJX6_ACTCC|nr:E3 ubiquitin-protein like [Actinidia chinensis var. chinensis]
MGSSSSYSSRRSHQESISKRIERVIRDESCPICLRPVDDRIAAVITACFHAYCVDCIRKWSDLKRKCPLCNANFDAWFVKINPSSRTFLEQQLPDLVDDKEVNSEIVRRRRVDPLSERRVLRRSREEYNAVSWRTRPLSRQRWFGRSESESVDAIAQRVLQWRLSIYEQHLQAVPCFSRSPCERSTAGNNVVRERILKRIEPWIRRELQAILDDPDPSVIVHVASAQFISYLEQKPEVPAEQSVLEDNYLQPLRRFLHDRTNMFWHELRCFAESPFNMETYDTIVEYRRLSY